MLFSVLILHGHVKNKGKLIFCSRKRSPNLYGQMLFDNGDSMFQHFFFKKANFTSMLSYSCVYSVRGCASFWSSNCQIGSPNFAESRKMRCILSVLSNVFKFNGLTFVRIKFRTREAIHRLTETPLRLKNDHLKVEQLHSQVRLPNRTLLI